MALGALLLCGVLAPPRAALAQGRYSLFVDGAFMADHDPTELFHGPRTGVAGRGGVGVQLSERDSIRFELDVPRWRSQTTVYDGPVFCASGSGCVGAPGFVPARTVTSTSVRSVSYAFLYGHQFRATRRLTIALAAGGSLEQRAERSSDVFDELGADGGVVRHTAFEGDRTRYWPAAVVGVDASIAVRRRLDVVPQFRFHTFPYPFVSISRPGLAIRWWF